jgi:signal transduction histidine kinase
MSDDGSSEAVTAGIGPSRGRAGRSDAGPERPTLAVRVAGPVQQLPLSARLTVIALAGAGAATLVGHEAAINPGASPPHTAALVRVVIIVALVGTGIYALTSHIQTRIGALLVGAGLFAGIWLLNGSGNPTAFTLGAIAAGLAPWVFSYVMLAHPTGRLRQPRESWLLLGAGGMLFATWILLYFTRGQPPIRTGLMQCVPHCPRSVVDIGSLTGGLRAVLEVVLWTAWAVLTTGTAWFAWRHTRSGPGPVRRSIVPVAVAAGATALLWIAFAIATAAEAGVARSFGAAYSMITLLIPIAVLGGLGTERLFMGRALAEFVTQLASTPGADPQPLMAHALGDPRLRICYMQRGDEGCVDFAGHVLDLDGVSTGCAVKWVRQGGEPVAAVIYDAAIDGQDRFVEAVGAAALMRLDRARLEVKLKASVADLAASRVRLMETADAERERIERDLHDSIQQDLVGLRIKLDLVAETFRDDPIYGEQMLTQLGRQMDDVLEALRSVARGVYPSLLRERGLTEALWSVGRRAPLAVAVHSVARRRYPEEIEVAVYFCCIEALQNAIKYAGPGAVVDITLRETPGWLEFQVRDRGAGFDRAAVGDAHGLLNMQDRAEAVGGRLAVSSRPGQGTLVTGRVPLP